jgi:hypothetical protein
MQFQATVSEHSHQINYITKARALTILVDLPIARICLAFQLKSKNLTECLLEFYPEIEPHDGQLETICVALNTKCVRRKRFSWGDAIIVIENRLQIF